MEPTYNEVDNRLNAARLIEYINQQSVIFTIQYDDDIDRATKWCYENVGDERMTHPMYECADGALDFFEGDWAQTAIGIQEYSFWFSKKTHRIQFKLIWC
jgi:hypothetical protein